MARENTHQKCPTCRGAGEIDTGHGTDDGRAIMGGCAACFGTGELQMRHEQPSSVCSSCRYVELFEAVKIWSKQRMYEPGDSILRAAFEACERKETGDER